MKRRNFITTLLDLPLAKPAKATPPPTAVVVPDIRIDGQQLRIVLSRVKQDLSQYI
ncbi:hypothetical protein IC229_33610 [Spirosoma sp. BT702]|uniref:Uncharacterized protein n=1 Tax=Spirosoma profusum TaxID=2771354 RepID=A0A927GAX1_9BACT|nr:hypothetical protein [Spirosoma profusum]MBD2705594.1 hypothetical protein [Spirosoma profusum]